MQLSFINHCFQDIEHSLHIACCWSTYTQQDCSGFPGSRMCMADLLLVIHGWFFLDFQTFVCNLHEFPELRTDGILACIHYNGNHCMYFVWALILNFQILNYFSSPILSTLGFPAKIPPSYHRWRHKKNDGLSELSSITIFSNVQQNSLTSSSQNQALVLLQHEVL